MGLDYEYRLKFPRRQLPQVLQAIADMAAFPDGEGTDVVFLDRTMHLPYTSNFKSGRIIFDDSQESLQFDTSLRFPVDEVIEQFLAKERAQGHGSPVDAQGYVAMGYVYLWVELHLAHEPDVIRFDFQPATTRMSLLFAASESIRQAFVQLLKEHEGIQGDFFDTDYHWGPVVIWPESDPDYDATNLLELHNRLSPNTPYYRKQWP